MEAAERAAEVFVKQLRDTVDDVHLGCVDDLCTVVGLCPYCVFRFLGSKSLPLYQQPPPVAEAIVRALRPHQADGAAAAVDPDGGAAGQTQTQPKGECPTCGGFIAMCHTAAIRDELTNRVRGCGYDFTTYILTVHLPAAFAIRQHSVWLYLRDRSQRASASEAGAAATKAADGTTTAAGAATDPAVTARPTAPASGAFAEKVSDGLVVDVKEAVKWILGPFMDRSLGLCFSFKAQFKIVLTVLHPTAESEATAFLSKFEMSKPSSSRRIGRTTNDAAPSATMVLKLLSGIKPDLFKKHFASPPQRLAEPSGHEIGFMHESVFVAGRYNKYCQKLSQTPWVLDDGTRMHESSVEELVSVPLLAMFKAKEYRFCASGREDIDVRMLGNGRPFYVELIDPHKTFHDDSAFAAMQAKINEGNLIQVGHLQSVEVSQTTHLKESEDAKVKHYRALIWTSRALGPDDVAKLNAIKDLKLSQKTPLRVLHRRSLATRAKTIFSSECSLLSPHFAVLNLKTSSGTYIKEFVHGDLGRTQTNIGVILGCNADILQLDVTAVETDFPPQIRPAPVLPHSFALPESFVIADREQREGADTVGEVPPPAKRAKQEADEVAPQQAAANN